MFSAQRAVIKALEHSRIT